MLITFPMAYPISLILDRILGKEIGEFYDRERLKELIKVLLVYVCYFESQENFLLLKFLVAVDLYSYQFRRVLHF